MELITGLFIFGLYKATERIWKKGFDAAWEPVDEALKARFTRWAGKGKEAERRAAFETAARIARANTLRTAADPQQAERILGALDGERDRRGAEALAEEAVKLMLFSAAPDVPRLSEICRHTLSFDALYAGETPPSPETVAVVLSDFLTNLREALLDQEPYHDLIEKDMRRALNEILAELRPVPYDHEATYRSQMAEMYRQLEFVGIPELKERRPITVGDIFIHLRAEREAERPEVPEGVLARQMMKERVDVEEALRETKRLVVLGDPGAGKTTLLKYLTVICAEGRAETELKLKADGAGSPLPIFVALREFAAECARRDQDYCLLDYLYTHAHEHLMLNLRRGFFEEALEIGRCLVCLDGLDEVWAVGQRRKVTAEVKALANLFQRSRYIVTSRIVGYDEVPLDRRDFVHHTILPLEEDDIREFVRKWYEVRERDPVQRKQKADDLIKTIKREPRIKALAANPLLLTIIALVHRIEAELPHERVKLYDKCVTALVDTWEEVKGLTIEEKQRPFYRQRRRLLERLAYELHVGAEEPGQLRMIREGDLELLLTRFLRENRRLGLADDADGARDEARAFIRLARGRTGLLVERGEDAFGFPHLTFQEYLAASDIENRCMPYGVDAVWKEIKGHLHDSHWREVILLLLGSLNRYEDAPTLLVERILEAGEEDRFEPVVHRCLYLAARALADKVDVADDLYRRVMGNLIEIARTAPRWEGVDAITALGRLEGDRYAAEVLLALARDGQVDVEVRRTAASALGKLGRAEEATEVLLALARDGQVDANMRRAVVINLVGLGRAEETTEALLALACDGQVDAYTRSFAAYGLGKLGRAEEATEALLALARDGRYIAAFFLGELGCADEKVLDGLLALARDGQVDADVRSTAAYALGILGRAEEATEVLLARACDGQVSSGERYFAAMFLGKLGRAEEEVLDGLLALARDGQVYVEARSAVASILGELGRADEKVLNGLLALACDGQVDAEVRGAAASALGKLGRADEKVLNGLLALTRDGQVDVEVRGAAASALGKLGRADEKVLDGLLALARDGQVDVEVRSTAAYALGELGRAEEATEALLALARDGQVDVEVRSAAASALGKLGRAEEATEVLLALARDEQVDVEVRRTAASALGKLGRADEKVLNGLLALARDGQVDAEVRSITYRVLQGFLVPDQPESW